MAYSVIPYHKLYSQAALKCTQQCLNGSNAEVGPTEVTVFRRHWFQRQGQVGPRIKKKFENLCSWTLCLDLAGVRARLGCPTLTLSGS